jgi:hypothetical protein
MDFSNLKRAKMATIQITDIPDHLIRRLETVAAARKHPLSVEVIERLDDSFESPRVAQVRSPEQLRELARQIRSGTSNPLLTPEFIRMAREYGRE